MHFISLGAFCTECHVPQYLVCSKWFVNILLHSIIRLNLLIQGELEPKDILRGERFESVYSDIVRRTVRNRT